MRLIEASGLGKLDPADLEVLSERLVEESILFLKGGGTVSLTEWGLLTEPERIALATAGHQMRAEMALAIGKAIDPAGAAELAQHLGEEDREHVELRTMVARAAQRVGT